MPAHVTLACMSGVAMGGSAADMPYQERWHQAYAIRCMLCRCAHHPSEVKRVQCSPQNTSLLQAMKGCPISFQEGSLYFCRMKRLLKAILHISAT
jgi:hypothetical protein